MPHVDLNSDLGESFGTWRLGDDDALLDVVTSANVACGFHAGDPATLQRTASAAAARAVAVGAQVSYPDLVGFGRREMDVAPAQLTADVLYQLGALEAFCRVAGTRVRYVKPHGALYHRVGRDERQAAALLEAVRAYDSALPVLGLAGTVVERLAADVGVRFVSEVFADRAVRRDGSLVPRHEPGAVLDDEDEVAERVVRMVTERRVRAVDGADLDVHPESVCVHSDTPGAGRLAARIRAALADAGVNVQPFA